jgi:hypothetical protein
MLAVIPKLILLFKARRQLIGMSDVLGTLGSLFYPYIDNALERGGL